MFISCQFLLMSLDQNQKINHDNNQTGTSFNQIRLNAEMLRVRTFQQLKQIQKVWDLQQQDLCQFFNNYDAMPYSKIDTRLLFKKSNLRLVRNDNKIYFGQTSNKKKQGVGITICKSGKIYQGNFHSNVKSGQGCQIYENGNIYIGSFLQNKKHGYGQFYWFNLSRQIVVKEHQQKFDVEHYIGDWWGGLPDGQGIHTKINGDMYQGKFKNGLKQGYGIEQYANGDEYRGEYVNGLAQGYGQYFWANGDVYKGDFKQGYKNGYGILKRKLSNQIYKGHFLLDMKHGYGIYEWNSGYKYKGAFFKDKRQGQGQLYLNQELIYKGIWVKGQAASLNDNQNPQQAQTMKKIKKSKSILKNSRTDEKIFTCQTNNLSQEPTTYYLKQYTRDNSATMKRNNTNYFSRNQFEPRQSKSFVVAFKHVQQKRTPPKRSCHDNCIPHYQYGKMPKPDWVHPKPHQRTALTPPKNQKRYHY